MFKKLISLTIFMLFCVSSVQAGYFSKDYAGTTGAQFLKIGCGARAISMGEAYTSISDEASAMYWNPAGISQLKQTNISLMHAVWFESINYDFIAFAQPTKIGTFGFSANYLYMDEMDKLDEYGDPYGSGKFSPYDLALNIAYSRKINRLMVGINAKYIQQKIDDDIDPASGFAVDLGYLYKFPRKKATVGIVIQNIGTQMKFIQDSFSLPLSIKLGLNYKLLKNILLALEGVAPIDNEPSLHFGFEYDVTILPVAFRLGYKTTTIRDLDPLSGLSSGIGFNIGCFNIDYAWVPYGDLGDTHRASINMKFGKVQKEQKTKIKKNDKKSKIKSKKNTTKKVKKINKKSKTRKKR